jgi:hypothetical protein
MRTAIIPTNRGVRSAFLLIHYNVKSKPFKLQLFRIDLNSSYDSYLPRLSGVSMSVRESEVAPVCSKFTGAVYNEHNILNIFFKIHRVFVVFLLKRSYC